MEMTLMRELPAKMAVQAAKDSTAVSATKSSNAVLNADGDPDAFSAKLSTAIEKKTPDKAREPIENKMTYPKKDVKNNSATKPEEADEDETPNTLQSTIAAPILGWLAQNAAEDPISIATNIAVGAIGQAVTPQGAKLDNRQMMQTAPAASGADIGGPNAVQELSGAKASTVMDDQTNGRQFRQDFSAINQALNPSSQPILDRDNLGNANLPEQDAKIGSNSQQQNASIPMGADQRGEATDMAGQIQIVKTIQGSPSASDFRPEPAIAEQVEAVQRIVAISNAPGNTQTGTPEASDRSNSSVEFAAEAMQGATVIHSATSAPQQETSLKVDRTDQQDSREQIANGGTTETPIVSTEKAPEQNLQKDLDQGANLMHEEKSMAAKHVGVMTPSFDNVMRAADSAEVSNRTIETPRADRYEIARQVMDGLQTSTDRLQTSQVIITLRPEHLGEVTVKINVDGDKVTAAFHAANAEVRSILEGSLPQFKQDMSQQGWNFDSEGIYSAMREFMGNGQNQQSQQFQQQELHPVRQKQESYDDAFAFGNTGRIQVMSASAVDYRI